MQEDGGGGSGLQGAGGGGGTARQEGPTAAGLIHLLIAARSQPAAFHSSGPSRGRSVWKWESFDMEI